MNREFALGCTFGSVEHMEINWLNCEYGKNKNVQGKGKGFRPSRPETPLVAKG